MAGAGIKDNEEESVARNVRSTHRAAWWLPIVLRRKNNRFEKEDGQPQAIDQTVVTACKQKGVLMG